MDQSMAITLVVLRLQKMGAKIRWESSANAGMHYWI